MKISTDAISKITVRTKNRLALELDCSVPTIERWMNQNLDNGDLTKTRSLEIISEETGIPIAEILQDSEVKDMQGAQRIA